MLPPAPYHLSWASSVRLDADGGDLLLRSPNRGTLRLRQPDAAQRQLLALVGSGGHTADALCQAVLRQTPGADLARLYHLLMQTADRALLRYTVCQQGQPWLTLEPLASAFRLEPSAATPRYQLSRFACLRRLGAQMVLECPLGHAQLLLHDARAVHLVALLSQAHSIAELATQLPELSESTLAAVITLLHSARVVQAVDADGLLPEDRDEPLQQWEFHDLLFHSRSRAGRHDAPMGATTRFATRLRPLPAVKPPMSTRRIMLEPPQETLNKPFGEVIEARRSQPQPGTTPLHVARLSALLYHAARVKARHEPYPAQPQAYAATQRPSASGGAIHALELYLTVSRCDGLPSGFYHYDPLAHALEHLADLGADHQRLLQSACQASGTTQPPDVLISMAARFQRNSWKYQSIAYALILKDVGALCQQLYLVATALQLAPCALGGGDSDLFAQLTGTDYYAETTVGEFTVSGA
ncbi:SagB family peptide dehydrogenase [Rhodoferax sp.]|uniref:SagB/ThcOx family dehydrogenase n=1 Tax=Rhodoferax sp. TaxID=50421 RepID=UPI0026272EA7|nr:SagB family peptide dehydrogenase [Rhodoferax sp.]MDD2923577.1 SagB family peptide dehydrogenase [Rhodoferax sp.]